MSWVNFATKTLTTKRASVESGKRGVPTTYLAGLSCTPLVSSDPNRVGALIQRLRLAGGVMLKEMFVVGVNDIVQGDIAVVDGTEYVVRDVATWQTGRLSYDYQHVTVEDLKGA